MPIDKKPNPLLNEINRVKGSVPVQDLEKIVIPGANPHINTNEVVARIKNSTDHINPNEIQKVMGGSEWAKKILESRAASKLAKMASGAGGALNAVGKHLPMIGGIAMGLGLGGKAMAGDLTGAALDGAEMVDPVGALSGVREASKRLDDPSYGEQASKQDLNNHVLEQTGDYSGADNFDENTMTPQEMEILKNRANK